MSAREDIMGNSPQDIMKMNDNFRSIWQKVFGGIDFSDINEQLKQRINTQWIQVQGEGNFDSTYPLQVRFYLPPNVKEVISNKFNLQLTKYRMDSSIAEGGADTIPVQINLSVSGGSGATGIGGKHDHNVFESVRNTGWEKDKIFRPIENVSGTNCVSVHEYSFANSAEKQQHAYLMLNKPMTGEESYTQIIKTDSHAGHTHPTEPHSHSGSALVQLEDHSHPLNEKIKVSSTSPAGIKVYVNGTLVDDSITTDKPTATNVSFNNELIKAGEWNIIEVKTTTVARMTVYGYIEILQQF